MTTTIYCEYKGRGDHLICQRLCKTLADSGEHVTLHAHSKDPAEWAALVDGAHEVVVGPYDGTAIEPCHSVDRGNNYVPWWQDMEERCGIEASLPTPKPLRRRAIDAAWPYYASVVLCPNTGFPLRRWPLEHWQGLERLLLEQRRRVVVLDGSLKDGGYSPNCWQSLSLTGMRPELVAAVIAGAECVVSADTGLAHLAGLFRRPTLVLGDMWPLDVLYGIYPTVQTIGGLLQCGQCFALEHKRAQTGCTNTCFNLATVHPRAVMDRLERITETDLCLIATLKEMVGGWAPRSYLEVGVREGDSLMAVLDNSNPSRLVLADTWGNVCGGSGRGSHEHIAMLLSDRGYDGDVTYLDGDSKATVPTLDEKFDLVLIDADHSEYGATVDLENAFLCLAPDGRIVFDDVIHQVHGYLLDIGRRFAARHPELTIEHENLYRPQGVMVFRRTC